MATSSERATHCSRCGRKIRVEQSALRAGRLVGKNHATGCGRSALRPDVIRGETSRG